MIDKIKIAFVGAGFMMEQHILAFNDVENVELAGIFSRTRERAVVLAEKFAIKHVCTSIRELFETTGAELVIVAVSEDSIADVCTETFRYPWKCLIEKPIGYNVHEAEKVLEASELSRAEVYVGLNRRHYSSTKAVMSQLESSVGQRVIHVLDQQDFSEAVAAGRPPHVVDNLMFMNSIHIIDYLCFLARGSITTVENLVPWSPNSPSFVFAKISYTSGDIGIYEAVWNRPAPWRVSVSTDQIYLEMRPLENASVINYGERSPKLLPQHDWDRAFKPGLRSQAEAAVTLVRTGAASLPTLSEAMRSQRLVASIYGL